MNNVSVCVVGVGYWGTNHIKNLLKLNIEVGCVDVNKERLQRTKTNYRSLNCFNSIEQSLKQNYDGYIIATPASTHAKLAKFLIKNNKPVLVEKPLSLSTEDSKDIESYIKRFHGKLIVGHLLLFHPAIKKMKSIIDEGQLGDIKYIYSNRLNQGKVRKEENVFWSFAPHDISLFQFFSGSFPTEVFSKGADFLQKSIHDTTITYFRYPNGIEGHIFVSWLHPFKEHRLVIIGSKGSLHFEDSNINKKLLFYENLKSDESKKNIPLKVKPMEISYDKSQPLENELRYFIDIIKGKKIKIAGINEGIEVIRILEEATQSLNSKK